MTGERRFAEIGRRMIAEAGPATLRLFTYAFTPGGKQRMAEQVALEHAHLRFGAVVGARMSDLAPEVERRRVLMGSLTMALDSVTDDVAYGRL